MNDIRYALRLMRRSPGFMAVAVVSLALGIGANTAIYSLFYTIMLRQLPVEHPEQLVELVRDSPDELHWAGYWDWRKYEYFRDHNHVFSGITGMSFDNLASVRTEKSDLETLILENVPGNYFQVLGLKPAIGRLIGPEDVPASGDGDAAVVSWSYWNRRFHRDPGIIGKRIYYNDAPKTIIGVAPRAYVGPRVGSRTDLWIPAHDNLTMLARLKQGVTHRAGAGRTRRTVPGPTGTKHRAQPESESGHEDGIVAGRRRPGARARPVRQAAGAPDDRVGPAVAAGVHQYGEHAAGAIGGTAAGTGRACGAGRRPRPAGEADADRIFASFRSRHAGRRGGGVLRSRHPGADHGEQPRIRAHRDRGSTRPEPCAFHRRNRALHRPSVRIGAGMVRVPSAAGNGFAADREVAATPGFGACSERAWWRRRWLFRFSW